MLLNVLIVIAGFFALIYGAEYFVKGSASVSRKLGISSFVVGLTVVAIGTSAPEFFVNVIAALENATDISISNILGSNTTDLLLGLGIAAIITPLRIKKGTTWKEIPFSLLSVLLILVFGVDTLINGVGPDVLSRTEGIALLGLFIIFIVYTFGISEEKGKVEERIDILSWTKSLLFILGGVLALIVGGKLVVDSAIKIASIAGLSQNLIGLTVVAIGTSLPEIVTAGVAAKKGHVDMVVGGIVGTVIFNSLFALGSTAIVRPVPFSSVNVMDSILLLFVTIILFISLFMGGSGKRQISKTQGVFFVVLYFVYLAFVILRG